MDKENQESQRAVMYLRVGPSSRTKRQAIDQQRESCQRIAEQNGLVMVREYVDVGRPARLDQQIELLHLLGDLHEQRDVSAVVVSDYARLAWSLEQLEQVTHHVQSCGAKIVTITGVETAERFVCEGRSRSELSQEGEGHE